MCGPQLGERTAKILVAICCEEKGNERLTHDKILQLCHLKDLGGYAVELISFVEPSARWYSKKSHKNRTVSVGDGKRVHLRLQFLLKHE